MESFSYVHKPGIKPLSYRTITQTLHKKKEYENIEAFVHHKSDGSRESITYKDLKDKSIKFARHLISIGIKSGDRVALCGPNSINWIIGEMGVITAGAVVVHVSISQSDAKDATEILNLAECKALLIDTGEDAEYTDILGHLLKSWNVEDNSLKRDMKTVLLRMNEAYPSLLTLTSIVDTCIQEIELPNIYPEDTAVVFTTSGSSGKPKMVEHTHFNILNIDMKLIDEDVIYYNDRPFVWLGGSPLLDLSLSQRRIFTDTSLSVAGSSTEHIWNIIRMEKCNQALLLPYFLDDLLKMKDKIDKYQLKYILTGGQIVNSKYLQVLGIFTERLSVGYGSSEVLGISIITFENANVVKVEGNTGKAFENVEVKIVDQFGQVTDRGELGEICVRSPFLMKGYLHNEEANKTVFAKGGWFKTGDVGYISVTDEIVIRGRIKDVISRGTRKIIPQSIEEIITPMKGILHVVVIAVPDERLYEEVCACFVLDDNSDLTPDSVQRYCEEKFLNKGTVDGLGEMPKYFLNFEHFPELPNGKVDKNQIKCDAIKKLSEM